MTIPSGFKTIFRQETPPTGWTKDSSYNEYTFRVVTGAASSGGAVDFSSVFNLKTFTASTSSTGALGAVVLTTSNIPSHFHQYKKTNSSLGIQQGTPSDPPYTVVAAAAPNTPDNGTPSNTGSTGSSSPHTHPIGDISFSWSSSSPSIDLRIRYIDTIIATRD